VIAVIVGLQDREPNRVSDLAMTLAIVNRVTAGWAAGDVDLVFRFVQLGSGRACHLLSPVDWKFGGTSAGYAIIHFLPITAIGHLSLSVTAQEGQPNALEDRV